MVSFDLSSNTVMALTLNVAVLIQGSIISAIGRGINAIISAIAGVIETIISAIVSVCLCYVGPIIFS